MLEALIAGERDPEVLAGMALTRMRPKIGELRKALVGRFDADHHGMLLRMHLDHVDQLDATITRLDAEVDRLMDPFAEPATRLRSIPGVGKRSPPASASQAVPARATPLRSAMCEARGQPATPVTATSLPSTAGSSVASGPRARPRPSSPSPTP
jgi:transposase